MPESRVYSFIDTQASFFGPTGFFSLTADKSGVAEEGITVTLIQDNATSVWGADGSWVHSLSAQKGADVSLKLLKNSKVNTLLSAMYNSQKTSSTLSGQNTIKISSSLGDTIILAGVIFKKAPTTQFGLSAQIMEWTFTCGREEFVLAAGL